MVSYPQDEANEVKIYLLMDAQETSSAYLVNFCGVLHVNIVGKRLPKFV